MSTAIYLSLWLSCLLTIVSRTSAQLDAGCTGIVSTYNETGLVVPFHNLCGKDIGAVVDFLDATNEQLWGDCMSRCVEKEPLCFGFDFRPLGSVDLNCWLMNASFDADTAVYPGYPVDAAMLAPALVDWLSDDCVTLGLRGCFLKNGRLDDESGSVSIFIASPSASSTVSSTMSTSTPANSPAITHAASTDLTGLSKGAKGGIGAGILVLLLLVVLGIFVLLKRRKQRARVTPSASAAEVTAHHQTVELLGHKGSYTVAELPGPGVVYELGGSEPEKSSAALGELVGSSPEKHSRVHGGGR